MLNRTNSIKDILEASKKAQKVIKENGTKPEYYQALRDGTASTIKFLRKNKTPDLYDLKHSFFKGHNAAFKKSMLPMNILKGLGAASLLGGGGYLTYSGIKDLVKESNMVKKAEALPWKDFLIKPKEVINNVKPVATEPPIVAGRKVTSTIKNIFKGLAGTRYIKPFMLGGLSATALGGGGAYLYNKEKETGYVADLIQQLRNKLNS